MRLIAFLNETTSPTYNEAHKIITIAFSNFLKQKDSNTFVLERLNSSLKKYNVEFVYNSSLPERINATCNLYTGEISVEFAKEEVEFLIDELENAKSISDLKDITDELSIMLSHELIHREQGKNIPTDIKDKMVKNGKLRGGKLTTVEVVKQYLSEPREIEAYAQQIIHELSVTKNSDTLKMYKMLFDKNSDVYKRLLKKIYFYNERQKNEVN
jgi:hypothetical protein